MSTNWKKGVGSVGKTRAIGAVSAIIQPIDNTDIRRQLTIIRLAPSFPLDATIDGKSNEKLPVAGVPLRYGDSMAVLRPGSWGTGR